MSVKPYLDVHASKRQLVEVLRKNMIWVTTQPGMTGDKPIAYYCRLCSTDWDVGRPEKHKPKCVLLPK